MNETLSQWLQWLQERLPEFMEQAKQGEHFWKLFTVIAVVATVGSLLLGKMLTTFILKTEKDATLLATGVAAQATILEVWETAVRFRNGQQEHVKMGFKFAVQPQNGERPFEISTSKMLPYIWAGQYLPGRVIPIRYNPKKPKEFAIVPGELGVGHHGVALNVQQGSPEEKLTHLQQLLEKKLITEDDYNDQKATILSQFTSNV